MNNIKIKILRVLKWSEKYTKTDMTYLFSSSVWLTTGHVMSAFFGLLLSVAFAHFVPPETYGTYKYIISLAGIVSAFSLTGMSTAVIQAVSRKLDGTLQESFKVSLKWGLVMTLLSWSGGLYYFLHDNATLALALLIVGIFQPILSSSTLFGSFLTGKKLFNVSTKYLASKTLFTTSAIFITIFFTDNLLLILLSYFVFNTIPAVFQYFLVLKKYPENNDTDPNTIEYSKHLSVMNMLTVISSYIDKIAVFQFTGPVDLAVYSFAIIIPEHIKGIFRNIINIALPKFSEKNNLGEIRKGLPLKAFYFGLMLACVSFAYIVVAPFIFTYIFPQYVLATHYSQVYAISLLGTISLLPLIALQAQQEKSRLYILNISNSLVQIFSVVLFGYFYGLWGVVFARVITRYIGTFISFYLLKDK